MKISLGAIVVVLLTYVGLTAAQDETSAWSDSFEALTAAPDSHKILYEDEKVRILKVTTGPGERGEMHGRLRPLLAVLHVNEVLSVAIRTGPNSLQTGRYLTE